MDDGPVLNDVEWEVLTAINEGREPVVPNAEAHRAAIERLANLGYIRRTENA